MSVTTKEAIERLRKDIPENELVLVSYWTEDDFQVQAEQSFDVRLTKEELKRAMEVTQDFDATQGINWSVIEDAIAQVLGEKEEVLVAH